MENVQQVETEAERQEQIVFQKLRNFEQLRKDLETQLKVARTTDDPGLKAFVAKAEVPAAVGEPLAEMRLEVAKVRMACAIASAKKLEQQEHSLRALAETLQAELRAAQERAEAELRRIEEHKKQRAVVPVKPVKPVDPPHDERRTTRRAALCTEISLHSESNFFTGFANDVSEGGVFMATTDVLDVGSELEVSFTLPGGEKIEAAGTVRWVRELDELNLENFPGMGIAFTSIAKSSLDAIRGFITDREPMFFPES